MAKSSRSGTSANGSGGRSSGRSGRSGRNTNINTNINTNTNTNTSGAPRSGRSSNTSRAPRTPEVTRPAPRPESPRPLPNLPPPPPGASRLIPVHANINDCIGDGTPASLTRFFIELYGINPEDLPDDFEIRNIFVGTAPRSPHEEPDSQSDKAPTEGAAPAASSSSSASHSNSTRGLEPVFLNPADLSGFSAFFAQAGIDVERENIERYLHEPQNWHSGWPICPFCFEGHNPSYPCEEDSWDEWDSTSSEDSSDDEDDHHRVL